MDQSDEAAALTNEGTNGHRLVFDNPSRLERLKRKVGLGNPPRARFTERTFARTYPLESLVELGR